VNLTCSSSCQASARVARVVPFSRAGECFPALSMAGDARDYFAEGVAVRRCWRVRMENRRCRSN
jgi:hypothetical protein